MAAEAACGLDPPVIKIKNNLRALPDGLQKGTRGEI